MKHLLRLASRTPPPSDSPLLLAFLPEVQSSVLRPLLPTCLCSPGNCIQPWGFTTLHLMVTLTVFFSWTFLLISRLVCSSAYSTFPLVFLISTSNSANLHLNSQVPPPPYIFTAVSSNSVRSRCICPFIGQAKAWSHPWPPLSYPHNNLPSRLIGSTFRIYSESDLRLLCLPLPLFSKNSVLTDLLLSFLSPAVISSLQNSQRDPFKVQVR